MRAITFDIETISNSLVRGKLDVTEQELTVVAIHDSQTNEYRAFFREDLPHLWPILEGADLLIGFNSIAFDIPVLNRYYPGDLSSIRSLDLMVEVQAVLGRRVRLQALAEGTLGKRKSGDGLQAGEWWRAGKKKLVADYCIDDVRLTRALYDHARAHGSLKFKDLRDTREVKLDTRDWETATIAAPVLTHALPL